MSSSGVSHTSKGRGRGLGTKHRSPTSPQRRAALFNEEVAEAAARTAVLVVPCHPSVPHPLASVDMSMVRSSSLVLIILLTSCVLNNDVRPQEGKTLVLLDMVPHLRGEHARSRKHSMKCTLYQSLPLGIYMILRLGPGQS